IRPDLGWSPPPSSRPATFCEETERLRRLAGGGAALPADPILSARPGGPQLSVVVPTRNEADNLPLLIGRLRQALAGLDVEICVVDDSDNDSATVRAALDAGR